MQGPLQTRLPPNRERAGGHQVCFLSLIRVLRLESLSFCATAGPATVLPRVVR